jgi:hypothetical protein
MELTKPSRLDDVIIAIMGIAGYGKTSFISLFPDRQVIIRHTLDSCKA